MHGSHMLQELRNNNTKIFLQFVHQSRLQTSKFSMASFALTSFICSSVTGLRLRDIVLEERFLFKHVKWKLLLEISKTIRNILQKINNGAIHFQQICQTNFPWRLEQ